MPKSLWSISIILLSSLLSCNNDAKLIHENPKLDVSLPLPDTLKAWFINSPASYYIYKGQPLGFEFELIEWFSQEHDMQLKVHVGHNIDEMFSKINDHQGHVLAANLNPNLERRQKANFSKPHLFSEQCLVQNGNHPIIEQLSELKDTTVYIGAYSSFLNRLENLQIQTEIPFKIAHPASDIEMEMLIEMVALDSIGLTVADKNMAIVHEQHHDHLNYDMVIGMEKPIAMAFGKDDHILSELYDNWLDSVEHTTKFALLERKYFSPNNNVEPQMADFIEGKISPYDKSFQVHSKNSNYDWKFIAAIAHQESRFNAKARSRFGARGLMQIMPATGRSFGAAPNQLYNAEINIKVGVSYLTWLNNFWTKRLPDSASIEPFVLASYNAGPGHVLDAQRLAEKYNLNPHVWDSNVSEMILKKSQKKYYSDPVVRHGYCRGHETYHYVNTIMKHYEMYLAYN